ncbi:MAG: MjaI family restriction endonuclease [Bacteroidales bacterium]|nr:MjaI family restriction endonuclease [Bacteroidales bacterium]
MAYTGGPLNELNGKMGISAPYKSVPVMKLIKAHKPKSKEELVELIKWHSENKCECGVVSQGTVESFGKNLYDSQISYWGYNKYSLQECIQWEYDLFVVQSLKGGIVEKKAIEQLRKTFSSYSFVEAEGFLDEELRIDIIINKNQDEVGGIQVKPSTFKLMRKEVITFNKNANQKWGKPVLYLFYDDKEKFVNLSELVDLIGKL